MVTSVLISPQTYGGIDATRGKIAQEASFFFLETAMLPA